MKKIVFIFILIISMTSYSQRGYNYPFKDPYIATVIGSSNMMTSGVSEEVPRREYMIQINPGKKPPKHLWYHKGFQFSLVKQDHKAPLIFLIAGTGTSYSSWKMKSFERIFYDAGFHVISISSPVNANFLITASNIKMPGVLFNDSHDIYKVMKNIYQEVKDKIDIEEFYLMGYSLGGTQAAYVTMLDDEEKYFNFKRVLMVNPAVNLYESAKILDDMLDNNIPGGRKNVGQFLEKIYRELGQHIKGDNVEINEDTIYDSFKDTYLSQKELAALIGIAFRVAAIDVNYLGDVLNKRGVYVPREREIGKFESLEPYLDKINFASFSEYLGNIAYPFYAEIYEGLTLEELIAKTDIHEIKDYLEKSEKIAMVTNEDELILTPDNLIFLKETFKGRSIIYPRGGHCGNMYYTTNVENMVRYFQKGVLTDEN
ncbi:serine/threonine protein kinase [uncultured Ilyobacter sp.]|uniref:serine/threonine protein kinase n=1 Tax=uncultured Ilyobacter sp. TaxID=544433 RepID=UPI002AA6E61F|nr:serine/threonine protein kinase [uncultured Ilyobacter sp.]